MQEAVGDIARDGPCENEGLKIDRVGPPVKIGPKISSINLYDAKDTPTGGGVRNEGSIEMIKEKKRFLFYVLRL